MLIYVLQRSDSHHGGEVGDDFIDGLLNQNVGGSGGGKDDNDVAEWTLSCDVALYFFSFLTKLVSVSCTNK
jgi:hypothetical protein